MVAHECQTFFNILLLFIYLFIYLILYSAFHTINHIIFSNIITSTFPQEKSN